MSATPSNARSGWLGLAAPRVAEPRAAEPPDDGRNALQALFAFACLHQQAIERRSHTTGEEPADGASEMSHQEFALDEVLQLVAARALSITGADGIAIALAHDGAIVCRAVAGQISPDRGVKLDPTSGFSGACLRSGETVRCDDSEIDARVNALACRALGARSMVAVPLAAKQHVIGLIEAFSKDTYGFNDSDVRSLNLLGELILAAIRPEEEDKLAEISRKIIAPQPATHPSSSVVAQAPVAVSQPKILVDEKFSPRPTPDPDSETVKAQVTSDRPASTALPEPAADSSQALEKLRTALSETAADPVEAVLIEPLKPVAAAALPSLEPKSAPERTKAPRSLAGTAAVAAAVLIVAGLGWLAWRQIRHAEQAASANNTPPAAEIATGQSIPQPEAPVILEPAPKLGILPLVTAVHGVPSANSSTVVIDLEDQVQYEAHTLNNPDRIYFDLHDTRIAPALANQTINLDNDPFLKRIRIAQPVDGVTRVVLETKGAVELGTVRLDPNPYRLNIEVHKPSAASEIKATVAPQVKPSPEIATPPSKGTASAPASSEFRLVLDAGHGGWDLGTVGKKGLLEKDLVLDVVQRLGKLAESKLGAQVVYTRQDDSYLPLEKRAEIANLAKANLFVSVHANYSDLATARGVETYYTNTYSSIKARTDGDDPQLKQVDWTGVDIRAKVTDSHRLAADVQQSLYGALAARNPALRNRGVKEAQYVVLTGTQMPAILAEVSFVSSPADEDKLESSDYRQQIAEALFKGIARYREENKHMKLASAKKN